MDEEDIERGVAARRRIRRQKRPGLALRVVGRRRRAIGLERCLRVQGRPHDLVAEQESRREHQRQSNQSDELQPAFERHGPDRRDRCGQEVRHRRAV